MKNKYDTSIVFLYATGNEHLLPEEFKKKIPYSTIAHWRKMDYGKYLGHEFRYLFNDATKAAAIHGENETLRRALSGIKRSWVTLSPYLLKLVKKAQKDKVLQGKILESIDMLKQQTGLDYALKLFGLSKTLYQHWILENRATCWDSYLSLCVKRHPYQLHSKEVKTMEKMLTDPELYHWPISAIASHGYREGKVVASLDTWYRCAKVLGITKKPVKKHIKTKGVRASCPNEYLHTDTTYYPMNEKDMVSITFVMDNYSKMILGYHISTRANFESVQAALVKALNTISLHPDQQHKVPEENHSYLVTDGGRENHNSMLDDFIAKLSEHKITKVWALKDIWFSNSPVEAIHRTIKGRYLRNRKFENLVAFMKFIAWAVKDYNERRPHYRHRPLTPKEVYFGRKIGFDHDNKVMNAVKMRIDRNKCSKCNECQCVKRDMECSGTSKSESDLRCIVDLPAVFP